MTDPSLAPEVSAAITPLADRLKLHAYELVNGGANASQLRNDLVAAADLLLRVERERIRLVEAITMR